MSGHGMGQAAPQARSHPAFHGGRHGSAASPATRRRVEQSLGSGGRAALRLRNRRGVCRSPRRAAARCDPAATIPPWASGHGRQQPGTCASATACSQLKGQGRSRRAAATWPVRGMPATNSRGRTFCAISITHLHDDHAARLPRPQRPEAPAPPKPPPPPRKRPGPDLLTCLRSSARPARRRAPAPPGAPAAARSCNPSSAPARRWRPRSAAPAASPWPDR